MWYYLLDNTVSGLKRNKGSNRSSIMPVISS